MNKLRSEKGASITFALLLFLVCAVLCSVILTAATSASGRMSQMAEMDQRYYSVTSSAEFLKDMFKNRTVKVERVIVTKTNNSYNNGSVSHGSKILQSDVTTITLETGAADEKKYGAINTKYKEGSIDSTTIEPGEEDLSINKSFLTDAALKCVDTSQISSETDPYYNSERSTGIRDILLTVSNNESLATVAHEEVRGNDDGSIKFTICNTRKNGASYVVPSDRYQLVLTFSESISGPSKSTYSVNSAPYGISDDGKSYSFDTTTTETITTKLKWNLLKIE